MGFRAPLAVPFLGFGGGGGAPAPAPAVAGDYGPARKHPRRIILPDGRVAQPRSEADYRRIVAQVLREQAPETVEKIEKPAAGKRRAKSIGRIETVYQVPDDTMDRIAALTAFADELHWRLIVQAARAQDQAQDDDALAAILILAS